MPPSFVNRIGRQYNRQTGMTPNVVCPTSRLVKNIYKAYMQSKVMKIRLLIEVMANDYRLLDLRLRVSKLGF